MLTGIYLSIDAPSAVNLMMAFQRAVFPKADYLRQMGISLKWPAHGLPLVISSDNGSDLKSKAFTLVLTTSCARISFAFIVAAIFAPRLAVNKTASNACYVKRPRKDALRARFRR